MLNRNLFEDTWNRRRVYEHHPEVQFKPGPFYMGNGILGWAVNINCILWTLFVTVIFSIPTVLPVTKENMNYASVITGGVIILAWFVLPSCIESLCALAFPRLHSIWYILGYASITIDHLSVLMHQLPSGRQHYHGPTSNLHEKEGFGDFPVREKEDTSDFKNDS